MKRNYVHKVTTTAVALLFAFYGSLSSAAAIYEFNEIDDNLVGTLTGSINLSGLTATTGFFFAGTGLVPISGVLSSITPSGLQATLYGIVGPTNFGTGVATATNIVSGLSIFASSSEIYIDSNYASGTAMSGSMSFLGASLNSLGITPGSYVYTFGNQDTFTLAFNRSQAPVPVPTPGPLALFGLGLIAMGWSRLKKV